MSGWTDLVEMHRQLVDGSPLVRVLPEGMKSVYETYQRIKSTDVRRIAMYVPGTSHALWLGFDADEVKMLDEFEMAPEFREMMDMAIRNQVMRLEKSVS